MNFLPQLIAHLAHATMGNEKPFCVLLLRSLGGVMLACGTGIGAYFLFQLLIPIVGYIESGLVISGIFLVIGTALLYFKPRKKADPAKEALLTAKNTIENINIPLQLEKHAGKLVAGAICAGFILSHLIGNKKS